MNPGEQLGIYRLVSRIGAGGMGEVWQAEDTRLRRTVAVKILSEKIAADEESQRRFLREARTAAPLYHPNIATVHAIEEQDGKSFIVMEHVSGETLTRKIARGALSEREVCAIALQVAAALEEAHRHGIVHRDIKPDNIILAGDKVKVLDFGIAKVVGPKSASGGDISAVVTEAGMILGTVYYMSPEQALGKPLDARTDLFSLGVVMYQALTGRLPFRGETLTETLTQIIRDAPPPIGDGIAAQMSAIVARCMEKEREDRYPSARELSEDLAAAAPLAQSDVPTEAVSGARPLAEPTIELPAPAPRSQTETIGMTGPPGNTSTMQPTEPTVPMNAASPPRRSRVGAIVVGMVLLLSLFTVIVATRGEKEKAAQSSAAAAVAPAAPVSSSAPEPVADPSDTPAAPLVLEVAAPAVRPTPQAPAVATATPETTEKVRAPKELAEEAYQRGLEQLAAGNRSMAALSFGTAVTQDPTHSPARMKLARGALALGKLPEAIRQYDIAYQNRERLSARDSEFAAIGAAIAAKEFNRAAGLAEAFGQRHPGDEELAALQRAIKRAEDQPGRPRRRP